MSNLNKVMLIGRLGKDPETRETNTGMKICNISLATSKKKKDNSQETQWHRVVLFDKTAENAAKMMRKGSKVYIEGEIKYGKYTDKENVERSTTDIMASNFQMLDDKPKEEGVQQVAAPVNDLDQDIPF